jgi:hypothetical protein
MLAPAAFFGMATNWEVCPGGREVLVALIVTLATTLSTGCGSSVPPPQPPARITSMKNVSFERLPIIGISVVREERRGLVLTPHYTHIRMASKKFPGRPSVGG